MSSPVHCPLCLSPRHHALPVAGKGYYRCLACELVWMDEADHLDEGAEKAVYDGHDNRVDDPRYRAFLMRAFGEVLARVSPPASGLDFGCGPPRAVLDTLWGCLKPGGVLVLQTQRVLGDDRFKTWRYRHDPTHIVFFAEASFRALAARWQAEVEFPHADVAVFTKP